MLLLNSERNDAVEVFFFLSQKDRKIPNLRFTTGDDSSTPIAIGTGNLFIYFFFR